MKKHSTKYKLTCEAPTFLTTYNQEVNKEIESYCKCHQQPRLEICLANGKCKYLSIKRYP